jgi:hypothetical protein
MDTFLILQGVRRTVVGPLIQLPPDLFQCSANRSLTALDLGGDFVQVVALQS